MIYLYVLGPKGLSYVSRDLSISYVSLSIISEFYPISNECSTYVYLQKNNRVSIEYLAPQHKWLPIVVK